MLEDAKLSSSKKGPENEDLKSRSDIVRVKGHLKEIVTVHDETGKIVHKYTNPVMVEFHRKDALQVIVGATLLAIPVAFTEEVWYLGAELPLLNVLGLYLLSIFFIALFIYYNYYKDNLKKHINHFYVRVFATYILSFIVVGVIMTLVGAAPWTTDAVLAIKRTAIVAFPASMSAAVADIIK